MGINYSTTTPSQTSTSSSTTVTTSTTSPTTSTTTVDEVEVLPELDFTESDLIFQHDTVSEFTIDIDPVSWAQLLVEPREYALATFTWQGVSHEVGVRSKGNVTFRAINDKPSLKVKFNWSVPGGRFVGLESINLHNQTYDPTMMAEPLAYYVYTEAGLVAPRTGFVNITINGVLQGYYSVITPKDDSFLEYWWEDPDGSLYESGSFNWPCDFNYDCSCFEHDEIGTSDDLSDLFDLCTAANTPPDQWLSVMQEKLDWDRWLSQMAADIAVAHYDNYGWNINNWHIYHEPTLDKWYFSPWSTDLAWGWDPWGYVTCGVYGNDPAEFQTGYLMQRCASNPDCKSQLYSRIGEMADHLEALDLPSKIAQLKALGDPHVANDTLAWYSDDFRNTQIACIRNWVIARPQALRNYIK
jgi:spore coat protein CotH